LGLGIVASQAKHVTDEMFYLAATHLASCVQQKEIDEGTLNADFIRLFLEFSSSELLFFNLLNFILFYFILFYFQFLSKVESIDLMPRLSVSSVVDDSPSVTWHRSGGGRARVPERPHEPAAPRQFE
jgi:hypothetical protein